MSWYQSFTQDQWKLLKSLVDGVIIRLGYGLNQDKKAEQHIKDAKNVGLPFAGYHWVDITVDREKQIAHILSLIDKFNPSSMFNDYEQYFTDWDAYLSGDYSEAYRTRAKPEFINTFNYLTHLRVSQEAKVPVGCYSASWFIDGYAPLMNEWIKDANYWYAEYFRYSDPEWWKDFKNATAPIDKIELFNLRDNYTHIEQGIGRQFESEVPVEGLPLNLDWNVFTDDGFKLMFGEQEQKPILQEILMRKRLSKEDKPQHYTK